MSYHESWEPRVFALHLLIGLEGLGAGPGGRAVREEMEPAHYLAASYYERWLYSAEQRLLRKGTIEPGDVEGMMERLAAGEAIPVHRDAAMRERMVAGLATGDPMAAGPAQCRFAVGDRVRVRRMHPRRTHPLPQVRPRRGRPCRGCAGSRPPPRLSGPRREGGTGGGVLGGV